jgi:Ni,Fe-hydrogenase III large subunit
MTNQVNTSGWCSMRQGQCVELAKIPDVRSEELANHLVAARDGGGRLANFFGRRLSSDCVRLYAFVAYDTEGRFDVCSTALSRGGNGGFSYPSVAARWPAAQAFEREIAEQYGVHPIGHPWLKPLRYHGTDDGSPAPWGAFDSKRNIPGDYPFYRVEGEEVHEVAVGPVHAGIIEPGHFRFQCHGEDVLHLEIVLGYQHRGAERLLLHPNPTRAAIVAENVAGDTAIGHSVAYALALEALSGTKINLGNAEIRGIALELERLANHVGDLGALCMDVAFLPASSYLGRLRGEYLNLTAELCGNRFGRNLVRPGGACFGISAEMAERMHGRLEQLRDETLEVLDLMFSQSSVLARFEGTGRLTEEQAEEIGMVGPAARACGVRRDVRCDHPHGVFQFSHIPMALETTGDVYARAAVRWLEVQRSLEFLLDILGSKPEGAPVEPLKPLKPFRPASMAFGAVETWRGEAMHVAFTDDAGKLAFVKVKDASIHNWFGLALALRGVAISDFPICNKSFNLSYCGHDL